MTRPRSVADNAPKHYVPTRAAMERLIRTGTRRLAILIDTAGGLPLASFDQAVKAAWEVTREREIRVWALWHAPGVMGRMVGAEEAELEHLQMVLGEQAGCGVGMEVEDVLYGLVLRDPDFDQAMVVTDRYHTVRGAAMQLEVPTIWVVPESIDDRIVVGINERFVLLEGERDSPGAARERAKRYRHRIRNEERRQGAAQVAIGAYPPMSSEPADMERLERCRAHAEWIAERAEGAIAERAGALVEALNGVGGRGHAAETRQRFDELAARCAEGGDTPWIGAAWIAQKAYLEIVAMGEAALPILLERIDREPLRWLPAIEAITGQRWEGDEHSAPVHVELWQQWGREHGYLAVRGEHETATRE